MREAVEKKVLSENDRLAAALRHAIVTKAFCASTGQLARLRQTALLNKTLETFPKATAVALLTGDLQTDNDARRLARHGCPVRQIVTGRTRHLDARMVDGHWNEVGFHGPGILFIENVAIGLALRRSGQD